MQLSFFVSSSIWTLVSISQVVESTVAIRPVKIPAEFDANITLFCDLFDELPDNVFWSKTPLNSTETINFINTNNIPIRYKIKTRPFSLNLSVSSLSIYGLTYEDEATFSCTGSTSSKINLTLKRNKIVNQFTGSLLLSIFSSNFNFFNRSRKTCRNG